MTDVVRRLPIEFISFEKVGGERVITARFEIKATMTISELINRDPAKLREALEMAKEEAAQHVLDTLKQIMRDLDATS